ncbi:TetR family transcriptional regulator [Nocardioides daejeonensis]|uniref:TetR family transcriptional regulator n=1 Tax=Nocardioides daejeonensis TaxID=1046556 RepID=UPI000D7462C8|nr:TetR family transcriptional regulator [Nocardioides daejeonensis]
MNAMNSLTNEELGSTAQRERRRRILAATIELASQGGFDAVQMRAVSERADVALGTLYRYFPSKIHLLVSALQVQFELSAAAMEGKEIPGETAADRVLFILNRNTKMMQRDPNLTEALTRAFMFADATVSTEIHAVGMMLTGVLNRAIDPAAGAIPTDDQVAVARVIGDVWLALLVGWVTGRTSTEEVSRNLSVAIHLLLR